MIIVNNTDSGYQFILAYHFQSSEQVFNLGFNTVEITEKAPKESLVGRWQPKGFKHESSLQKV